MAQEWENFGHEHPLILLNEGDDEQSNQREEEEAYCFRCGEEVLLSAACYKCVKCSGIYLHKVCADAPLEINHPFHPNHPLLLLQNNPYPLGGWTCNFCDKPGQKFVYHCSCNLDFHIRCALFTCKIAQKNLNELGHVAYEDPTTKTGEQLEHLGDCFGCWEPLANSIYFSPDICGFNLHKKCAELSLKINHRCHRKHPLLLQFLMLEPRPCKICQANVERRGLVYCCLACDFFLHIQCVSSSPPPSIEDKRSHPHPFTLFRRRAPFICDACGTQGSGFAYLCSTCDIMVHQKCISLPRIIKSRSHEHRIVHTYFIEEEDFHTWDCIICLEEINMEHGSYYCSHCKIVAHVNCATKYDNWYYVVKEENEDDDDSLDLSPIVVIKMNDAGEATTIKHFKHDHNLMLANVELEEYVDKRCDGCVLPISPPYFGCSESGCNFSLHKGCAELPKKKQVWLHGCQEELCTLVSDYVFRCGICGELCNGFGYKCDKCGGHVCFKCVTNLTQGPVNCPKHAHPLLFYLDHEGACHGCGDEDIGAAYYCKGCKFALCFECLTLQTRAQHKCDEKHLLALTYRDDNDYSATHYCDICEETRDTGRWFYRCATCDTCAHVKCVLGDEPFIKIGSICKLEDEDDQNHEHPLTFVKKTYYYPKCIECGEHCQDLGVECAEPECSYIAHWGCINNFG